MNFAIFQAEHISNKTPVLGNAIPVFGMKLKQL